MNHPLDPAIQPENATGKQETVDPPVWKQLPAEQQCELVTILAMMLIKRLPKPHKVPKEVNCEHAS